MRVVHGGARAAGLVIGVLADGVFGDPRRGHPVAAFGTVAAALERRLWRDSVPAGAAYAGLLVGGTVLLGAGVERAVIGSSAVRPDSAVRARCPGSDHGVWRVGECVVVAAATWAVLGGHVAGPGRGGARPVAGGGDLAAARARIPHLCARDPALLDGAGMARAGVESLAENTSDAVVAPAVLGRGRGRARAARPTAR